MGYLLEYDETNPISIETYGKRLIGKTFQDNKKKITVLNDKKKNADSEKAKIIKEEIKDLRNEKKHNQQELDELKNLYKISDEIEEI